MNETNEKQLRNELSLKEQVEEQLKMIRYAWTNGNIPMVSRGVEIIRFMLWQRFPKEYQRRYNEIKYVPMKIEELYNENDRRQIKRCGELESQRKRYLYRVLVNENTKRFFVVTSMRMNIFMETLKILGTDYEMQTDSTISHIKKKSITSGKK